MAIQIRETDLRFNSNHVDRVGPPKGILLHHAASNGSVEEIHAYHKNINGWAGIGYHFYIRKNGNIFRGRPENWMGGHATGYNDHIGVCAEGNFENDTMPTAQQAALVEVLKYLFEKYGTLTVSGHRQVAATACPGKNYPLDAIVKAAQAQGVTPSEPQTESYGPSAKSANILAFQKAVLADGIGLPKYGADGIWGKETAAAATNALLRNGSTGERVRLLQTYLKAQGLDLGSTGVDGVFGAKTQAAVRAYQSQKGLAVDGIVGINTWKALLGV